MDEHTRRRAVVADGRLRGNLGLEGPPAIASCQDLIQVLEDLGRLASSSLEAAEDLRDGTRVGQRQPVEKHAHHLRRAELLGLQVHHEAGALVRYLERLRGSLLEHGCPGPRRTDTDETAAEGS